MELKKEKEISEIVDRFVRTLLKDIEFIDTNRLELISNTVFDLK